MLPRHAYLSATMLALTATMTEEDSHPEPDDEGSSYDKAHSYLGDDLDYLWQKGKQEGSHYDLDAGQGHGYDGRYEPSAPVLTGYAKLDAVLTSAVGGSLNVMIGGASRKGRNMYKEYIEREAKAHILRRSWGRNRSEQRADKKVRAKRKAKKGWA